MAKLRGCKNSILETCVEMLNEGLLYSDSSPDILVEHVMACIVCLEDEILKFKEVKITKVGDPNGKDWHYKVGK